METTQEKIDLNTLENWLSSKGSLPESSYANFSPVLHPNQSVSGFAISILNEIMKADKAGKVVVIHGKNIDLFESSASIVVDGKPLNLGG